jgi:hypothetical protein
VSVASATRDRDVGAVSAVELMFLLVGALVSLALLAWAGRLHSAAVEVEATARAAARAASLAGTSDEAAAAADDVVRRSPLAGRCAPSTSETTWVPSELGTWQGGSVTVTIRCRLSTSSLVDRLLPGARTLQAADTEAVDRYRR